MAASFRLLRAAGEVVCLGPFRGNVYAFSAAAGQRCVADLESLDDDLPFITLRQTAAAAWHTLPNGRNNALGAGNPPKKRAGIRAAFPD
jgi:hypothetical protein